MINQLKEIRKNTGLTQQEFAKELDVALSTVASVENGTREISKSVMKVLIEKYNISANWLLTGDGEMYETKDVATKEEIANIPIIKNKIEKTQEIVLNNKEIIDGHISLSAMFPIPKENLAAFIMNDNSMSGAGFLMQDILFIDTRSCGLDDNAYLFVQNEKVYCRLFLFEEISNTVRICAMHTPDIRDVSVLDKIKIPEMENKYKIIGKVLAFLRKNSLF